MSYLWKILKDGLITVADQQSWEANRVVKVLPWSATDSIALAIYAAELVLHRYEEHYPSDDRPRKAIEAAKEYLENPSGFTAVAATRAARSAARAAWSAEVKVGTVEEVRAARAAGWAAQTAASGAWAKAEEVAAQQAAAWAVRSATRVEWAEEKAVDKAEAAAGAARAAAWAVEEAELAGGENILGLCEIFIQERFGLTGTKGVEGH